MAYEIQFTPQALRQIEKLPRPAQQQVHAKIQTLATEPRPSGVMKLQGDSGLYRVRIGDYRVQYLIEDARLVVVIVAAENRRDAYKKR